MSLDRNRTGELSKIEIRAYKVDLQSAVGRRPNPTQHPLSLANDLSNRTSFDAAIGFLLALFADPREKAKARRGAGAVLEEFMMTEAMGRIVENVTPLALDPTQPDALVAANLLRAAWKRYAPRREEILTAMDKVNDTRTQLLKSWLTNTP